LLNREIIIFENDVILEFSILPKVRENNNNNNNKPHVSISGFQCVAKNIETSLMFYTSDMVYSQIWPYLSRDDHHFFFILPRFFFFFFLVLNFLLWGKKKKKKKINLFYISSTNYCIYMCQKTREI
jgi:hypothetical protein